jgi:hypothetical protein
MKYPLSTSSRDKPQYNTTLKPNSVYYLPTMGILIFIGIYIFAASLYPGGSQADIHAEGFSWLHNYWCNLMNEKAVNGLINPARPFAILGMVILCLSLLIFFILFAKNFVFDKKWQHLIQINGIISMLTAILIFTQYHDIMTIISSFFGLIVLIGIIKEIYNSSLHIFKITGLICLILLALNNYIYYTKQGLYILPLLQKCTFAIASMWVIGLNWKMIHSLKKSS